jgi:hypothetical protein
MMPLGIDEVPKVQDMSGRKESTNWVSWLLWEAKTISSIIVSLAIIGKDTTQLPPRLQLYLAP